MTGKTLPLPPAIRGCIGFDSTKKTVLMFFSSTPPRPMTENPISTRDLTFMRFLFANDTSKVDHKRLCSRLSLMRKHPGDSILHTVDYTHSYPKQYIGPLERRVRGTNPGMSAGMSTSHAARPHAGLGRQPSVPSHCSTLHNGLIRIPNDIHPDDTREEVEKLPKENGDVVQIHP
ncbi:hypothetical protein B0H13DRAFT_1866417 [Mycena leptocephala]|nr:hypothetical protein B0H13DRAFT_1866417 [Mycena leptocephala]